MEEPLHVRVVHICLVPQSAVSEWWYKPSPSEEEDVECAAKVTAVAEESDEACDCAERRETWLARERSPTDKHRREGERSGGVSRWCARKKGVQAT